uniref:Putative secreted protein n=1 Tax=Anopheles darlingi TaxID=43151 RepID=A0A2M4DEY8_ANODA
MVRCAVTQMVLTWLCFTEMPRESWSSLYRTTNLECVVRSIFAAPRQCSSSGTQNLRQPRQNRAHSALPTS